MLPADVQRTLLSEELLQEWAVLTSVERVHIIESRWNIKISPTHLRRFYKRYDVKFQSGKQCYKAAITRREELEGRRLLMARVLAKFVSLNRDIIYVDETSFNTHQTPLPKSWSLKQKHNKHAIGNKRFSTTVYGAIGNCLTEPVFYTGQGTN